MKTTEFTPIFKNNFFNEENYNYIYNKINNVIDKNIKNDNPKYTDFVVHERGFAHYMFSENEEDELFFEEFCKAIEEKLGIRPGKAHGFFARYSNEHGTEPSLSPHIDKNGNKIHTFSLSLQLDSNVNWDFYVEDEKFVMEKNDVVFFTGSKHVHWRPFKKFEDGDYYDIFVAHFTIDGEEEALLPNQDEISNNRKNEYYQKYKHLIENNNM
jgi:hypothetical protein